MKIITSLVFFLYVLAVNAQDIRVCFNQSVDNSISSLTDAKTSIHLDDTIKFLIDQAAITLDIAVWDNGSSVIVGAINAAYNRGVQVRYITSTNSFNSALSGMHASIPVLKRNSGLTSNVMHNKFVIVDGQQLITGSMNFGNGSMFDDYNNLVIIDNSAIAQTYAIEFNEMWGSSGAQPNLTNSKFGIDKTDNTTHTFNLAGRIVQSYFSPTDNTTLQIVNAINSADFTLDIAMFTFINNDIGDAVVAAKLRGVNVRCIIENVNYFGSEYNNLLSNGINVLSHSGVAFDLHHKYCIIDAFQSASDPLVVTGSHNWTNSAEQEYDENTLIIHDILIAQQYTEEFSKRFTEMGGVGIPELYSKDEFLIYPNPSEGTIYLSGDLSKIKNVQIVNSAGVIIQNFEKVISPISENLNSGIYFLKITTENGVLVEKFSVN